MKREATAAILSALHPPLSERPHIVDQLIDLVLGEWEPDLSEQEQLATHLVECSHCRTATILVLAVEQDHERSNSHPGTVASSLLARFVAIHHEIEAQEYEQLGAYAEAIVAEGNEKADKRFSTLAEHIRKCSSCKYRLEELLSFLREHEAP